MVLRRATVRGNLVALALGLLLVVVVLVLAELVARGLDVGAPRSFERRSEPYLYFDEQGVKRLRPGSYSVAARRTRDRSVIYEVDYTIDELGRRVTRPRAGDAASRFAVFLGGSFVFGEGVEDDETLPSQLARLGSGLRPYNYGVEGYGPHDVLARVEDDPLESQIDESTGVIVYVFIDRHIQRVTGAASIVRWHRSQPHYHPGRDGELRRFRNFEAAHPIRTKIYRGIHRSRLLRAIGFDWPLGIRESDVERTAKALAAVGQAARRSLPGGRFLVVVYPGSRHGDRLGQYLEARGVDVLDYSTLFGGQSHILSEEDQHPNSAAYRILADRLARDLSEGGP